MPRVASAGDSRAFAPGEITMVFSPASSTVIIAVPVAESSHLMRLVTTPAVSAASTSSRP